MRNIKQGFIRLFVELTIRGFRTPPGQFFDIQIANDYVYNGTSADSWYRSLGVMRQKLNFQDGVFRSPLSFRQNWGRPFPLNKKREVSWLDNSWIGKNLAPGEGDKTLFLRKDSAHGIGYLVFDNNDKLQRCYQNQPRAEIPQYRVHWRTSRSARSFH